MAAGCSGDDGKGAESASSTASANDAVVGRSGGSSVPVTVVPEELAVPDSQRDCVQERLGDGVEAAPAEDVEAAVAACANSGVFAAEFVESLARDHPGHYSDDQLVCVGEAFGALSAEDAALLIQGALDPALQATPETSAVIAGLFAGCGVEPPSP